MQQQLQTPQGLAVGLIAAPITLLAAAQGEAVDPFAADQAHAGADRVFLEHQIPARGIRSCLPAPRKDQPSPLWSDPLETLARQPFGKCLCSGTPPLSHTLRGACRNRTRCSWSFGRNPSHRNSDGGTD